MKSVLVLLVAFAIYSEAQTPKATVESLKAEPNRYGYRENSTSIDNILDSCPLMESDKYKMRFVLSETWLSTGVIDKATVYLVLKKKHGDALGSVAVFNLGIATRLISCQRIFGKEEVELIYTRLDFSTMKPIAATIRVNAAKAWEDIELGRNVEKEPIPDWMGVRNILTFVEVEDIH